MIKGAGRDTDPRPAVLLVFRALPVLLALSACGSQDTPGYGGSGGVGLAAPARHPIDFGPVGEFSFQERNGASVTRESLLGSPSIVGFMFTRCAGPCPKLTANMRRLQEELEGTPVRLVSISVDPEYDTPEVLRAYADSYTADPERWWFLTGDEQETYELIRGSFALSVDKLPDADVVAGLRVTHATRLVTVDAAGLVRGYYDGESDEGVSAAAKRARFLAGGASPLPAVNASLNATSASILVLGLVAIKAGRRRLHAGLMRTAFLVSLCFLASYLYYHFVVVSQVGPTSYNGSGWKRAAYFALLLSHTLLAIVNLPMVLRTLWLAHRERWEAHARMARVTFPIWLYVSVTGVLVYLVLYQWNPDALVDLG